MKIGITIDLSLSFWANGLQQNIVFLNDLLSRVPSLDCFYITNKPPSSSFSKKHQGLLLQDLLDDDSFSLDILFVAGFDLLPEMYDTLKKRNPNLKVVLIHYGNKLFDDLHHSSTPPAKSKFPLKKPKYLSQVWMSPQHQLGLTYLKTYYNFEDIIEVPYIWDSFFVEEALKPLKSQGLSPLFDPKKARSICVFEPNKSHIKHCLIPVMICERSEQLFPNEIDKLNVFCCEKIRSNHYFEKLMNRLSLVSDGANRCFFNNRWSSLTALSKFGSTIISNQINNNLNYAYLEALHLGLPLIHNSSPLSEVGYYYPDLDIDSAAKQLQLAMKTHANELEWYRGHCARFIQRYSSFNQTNIDRYAALIHKLYDKPQ